MTKFICDFCCDPDAPVRWAYPVDRARDPSGDDWAACQLCHADIEAGRWEEVVSRSLVNYKGEHPIEVVRRGMRKLFKTFSRVRTGPAVPEPWDLDPLHIQSSR